MRTLLQGGYECQLVSRNGKDRTRAFSAVTEAVGESQQNPPPGRRSGGVRSGSNVRFQLLQDGDVVQSYAAFDASTFDCLYKNGRDLGKAPLPDRRRAPQTVISKTGRIFPSRLVRGELRAYRVARRNGFEGVAAKDLASFYIAGAIQ